MPYRRNPETASIADLTAMLQSAGVDDVSSYGNHLTLTNGVGVMMDVFLVERPTRFTITMYMNILEGEDYIPDHTVTFKTTTEAFHYILSTLSISRSAPARLLQGRYQPTREEPRRPPDARRSRSKSPRSVLSKIYRDLFDCVETILAELKEELGARVQKVKKYKGVRPAARL